MLDWLVVGSFAALRCVVGYSTGYGLAWFSASFLLLAFLSFSVGIGAAFWAYRKGRECPPKGSLKILSRTSLVGWVLLSFLFFLESLVLNQEISVVWALLVLAPLIISPCEASPWPVFAAALPALCAVAEMSGAFTAGAVRFPSLFSLVGSVGMGGLIRLQGQKKRHELEDALQAQKERERALASLRDAEVEVAARIQRSLLIDTIEKDFQVKDIRLEAITVASNAVDGDFYGIIPYSPRKLDLLIGDVMGKGIPAALVGAALKGAFLRNALQLIVAHPARLPEPVSLVEAVHRALVEHLMDLDSFATFQFIRFDSTTHLLEFVDCGHTPFIHYDRALATCWFVQGLNLPIGFTSEQTYWSFSLPFLPGDRILFYSDGVSEATNERHQSFGEQRLAEIVQQNAFLEPREMIRRILNTAMFFASSEGFKDDVTLVAVALEPDELSHSFRFSREFSWEIESLRGVENFITLVAQEQNLQRIATSLKAFATHMVNRIFQETPGFSKKDTMDRPSSKGEQLVHEELEPLEENENERKFISSQSPGETLEKLHLRAYRVEVMGAVQWVNIRILYYGAPLPWQRGMEDPLSRLSSVPPVEESPPSGDPLPPLQKKRERAEHQALESLRSWMVCRGMGGLAMVQGLFSRE
ncbi:MAG: PP2C family protein-serine/threonine phosphatase [Treponemataceae bacterium]|nr:PP2C family protein-serine/threonine phosphatase [Treponemataceae bacterium]